MTDPHLNLFYSYNRDIELIENNLTRALIVTLRLLSGETRNKLLRELFDIPIRNLGGITPPFSSASFTLQGYFDTSLLEQIKQKWVVTIATERELQESLDPSIQWDGVSGDSIPDAWIYDPDEGYCFLIEAKIGSNPLDARQVLSHAKGWLGIPKKHLSKNLIPLTWPDILRAIESVDPERISSSETKILGELTQFLGYYGYDLFEGFEFDGICEVPNFSLEGIKKPLNVSELSSFKGFYFEGLLEAPELSLAISS